MLPEGTGYRMRTRCSKFHNLPELMNIFAEVADIKTAESLNLPRPKGNFHTITSEPTPIQKEMVDALGLRAKDVRDKLVKPEIDNMLAITNDGRKLGLDQRVINPNLPDDPNSKINKATANIYKIWEDTKEKSSTQVVFCDLSTPKNEKENKFSLYDDIKQKLIKQGIPKNEIAFIHDAKTDKQRQDLFGKVNKGKIRILVGSTEKMGAGTNIQEKLVALHHIDCPWRPSDLAQREGRILRRGNGNDQVDIYKYVTKDTFDAYLYQTIEKKQQFISQIMTDKSPMRSLEDIDKLTLNYAEIKALCVGNPKIKEKMDLEQDIKKLTVLQLQHKKNIYNLQDSIAIHLPKQLFVAKNNITNYKSDLETAKTNTKAVEEGYINPLEVQGQNYNKRSDAGEAIKEALKLTATKDGAIIGAYRGFKLHGSYDIFTNEYVVTLKGEMNYPIKLEQGFSGAGIVTRLDNIIEKIQAYVKTETNKQENILEQIETAKTEVEKPFAKENELKDKIARVTALTTELSLDANRDGNGNGNAPQTERETEKQENIKAEVLIFPHIPEPPKQENNIKQVVTKDNVMGQNIEIPPKTIAGEAEQIEKPKNKVIPHRKNNAQIAL